MSFGVMVFGRFSHWSLEMTGVDIYLLDQNGEITTIVEVKRYPPQRKSVWRL